MTVRYTGDELVRVASTSSVAERLFEEVLHKSRRRTSPSEVRSWKRSIPVLAQDLIEAGLGSVEVLLEYQLPLTSLRADVVLAGAHPKTGKPSFVVVELKQWTEARSWEGDPNLVVIPGLLGGPKLHPTQQVRRYSTYIADFARALDSNDATIVGVAYLHNAYDPLKVSDLFRADADVHGQLFIGADRSKFQQYLRQWLSPDIPGSEFADLLLNSAVAPSRQLLAVAAQEVRDREQFTLQDDQQLAVNIVMHEVLKAHRSDHGSVIIVSGGPGSGKSVIALSLLGDLARQGRSVIHATGSRAFTLTLRQVAGARAPRVRSLFKYFYQLADAEKNGLDVLILDEAHRMRTTSVHRYTRAALRTGRPQVDELISAARVPVFLLDQNQIVRPGEMGSAEVIRVHAESMGLKVFEIELSEQFRCGGSAAYVDWVERLLGISNEPPNPWTRDDRFDVRVAETLEEMDLYLDDAQREGYTARMTAGYCWPWSSPRDDGTLVHDVRIGDWSRPWNVRGDRAVGEAPPAALWSINPGGAGQIGCIYTAQGFEYDWNGVIIGPDLVWRDGGFVSCRAQNRDPDFKSTKQISDDEFDGLIRNVYKVLLTRGMVGTVLYSTDSATRSVLRELVGQRSRIQA